MTAEAAITVDRPVAARGSLPKSARLLILLVVAAGAAELARLVPAAAAWSGRDVLVWAALTVGIAVAEVFPVSLKNGDKNEDFLSTDVPFTAVPLLATPG